MLLIASGLTGFQVFQFGGQRENTVAAEVHKEFDARHASQFGGAPGRQAAPELMQNPLRED